MTALAQAGLPEEEVERVLQEPYTYITQMPGKDVRGKLIQAFDMWLQVPSDRRAAIQDVTKVLHNASLLIDDIEDNSKLRRGLPVAHSVYGIPSTINCANYMYFRSMELVTSLRNPEASCIFTEQLLDLHRGQGLDIYWRDNLVCPTEEQYREMVKLKTGGLFALAIRLMQLFSETQIDLLPLVDTLGLYFQIRDDYANLVDEEYTVNKTFCEDLTEGKFSFPIIHHINNQPKAAASVVLNILRQRTEDVELKRHAVECMKRSGSLAHTLVVLNELVATARQQIKDLGGNPMLEAIVDRLTVLHSDQKQQPE